MLLQASPLDNNYDNNPTDIASDIVTGQPVHRVEPQPAGEQTENREAGPSSAVSIKAQTESSTQVGITKPFVLAQNVLSFFVGVQMLLITALVYQTTLESCMLSMVTLEYRFESLVKKTDPTVQKFVMHARPLQLLSTKKSSPQKASAPASFQPKSFQRVLFKEDSEDARVWGIRDFWELKLDEDTDKNKQLLLLANYLLQVQRVQNQEVLQGKQQTSWVSEDVLWPSRSWWSKLWAPGQNQYSSDTSALVDLNTRFSPGMLGEFDYYYVLPSELRPKQCTCTIYSLSSTVAAAMVFMLKSSLQLKYAVRDE